MRRAFLLYVFCFAACSSSSELGPTSSTDSDSGTSSSDAGSSSDASGGSDSGALSDSGTDASASNEVLLGVYSDTFQDLNSTVRGASGRNIAIENQRETWGSDFAQADEAYDLDAGVIPMISWAVAYKDPDGGNTCASPVDIVKGKYDDTWTDGNGTHPGLKQEADTVKSWNVPVLIRFFKEFTDTADEACFYGSGGPANEPATYGPMLVSTWQHVVDVFKARGATNVQWVWGPSANLFGKDADAGDDTTWRYFYPGNNYVDWISNDNYNKSDTKLLDYSADPSIQNWYGITSKIGKPLMQAETGAGYDAAASPDPMTEWISTAYAAVKTDYPAMKAFVWWSSQGQVDYDLQGPGLAVYENMAKDPLFHASSAAPFFSSKGSAGGPTPPANPVSVWSGTDVNVSWNASADAFGTVTAYDVYCDGAFIGTSTTTSYVDTKPKQHQQHTYAIDAIDSALNRSPLATALTLAAN